MSEDVGGLGLGGEDSVLGSTTSEDSSWEPDPIGPESADDAFDDPAAEDEQERNAIFEEVVDRIGDLPTDQPVGEYNTETLGSDGVVEVGGETGLGAVSGVAHQDDGFMVGVGAAYADEDSLGVAGFVGLDDDSTDASATIGVFEGNEIDASAKLQTSGEGWDLGATAVQDDGWQSEVMLEAELGESDLGLSAQTVESGQDSFGATIGYDEGSLSFEGSIDKTEGEAALFGAEIGYDEGMVSFGMSGEKAEGTPPTAGVDLEVVEDPWSVDASVEGGARDALEGSLGVTYESEGWEGSAEVTDDGEAQVRIEFEQEF